MYEKKSPYGKKRHACKKEHGKHVQEYIRAFVWTHENTEKMHLKTFSTFLTENQLVTLHANVITHELQVQIIVKQDWISEHAFNMHLQIRSKHLKRDGTTN